MRAATMMKMMQKHCIMLLCLAILCGASRVGAQAEAASSGDSLVIRQNIFHRLFDGIALSPAQRTDAERAIASADRQSWALMPVDTREGWERLVQIQAHRDSVLRQLLVSDADRGRFDERVRRMRLPPWDH